MLSKLNGCLLNQVDTKELFGFWYRDVWLIYDPTAKYRLGMTNKVNKAFTLVISLVINCFLVIAHRLMHGVVV